MLSAFPIDFCDLFERKTEKTIAVTRDFRKIFVQFVTSRGAHLARNFPPSLMHFFLLCSKTTQRSIVRCFSPPTTLVSHADATTHGQRRSRKWSGSLLALETALLADEPLKTFHHPAYTHLLMLMALGGDVERWDERENFRFSFLKLLPPRADSEEF